MRERFEGNKEMHDYTFSLSTLSCLITNPVLVSSPKLSMVNSPKEVTLPISGQYWEHASYTHTHTHTLHREDL